MYGLHEASWKDFLSFLHRGTPNVEGGGGEDRSAKLEGLPQELKTAEKASQPVKSQPCCLRALPHSTEGPRRQGQPWPQHSPEVREVRCPPCPPPLPVGSYAGGAPASDAAPDALTLHSPSSPVASAPPSPQKGRENPRIHSSRDTKGWRKLRPSKDCFSPQKREKKSGRRRGLKPFFDSNSERGNSAAKSPSSHQQK